MDAMARGEENKTILIVDNDPEVRIVLRGLIERMGYEAFLADRASEALRIMERESVDALLLDIHMPGPHGHHMLRFLKKRNRIVPPTVVVSGYLNKELIPELISLGVSGVVAKPFRFQRLYEEINRALAVTEIEAKVCSACGHPFQLNDQFCRKCGRDIVSSQKCSVCGEACGEEDRFCGKCGQVLK